MKRFILIMATAAMMLAGCKAKTEKVTDQQIEDAVEQCCGECDGNCDKCATESQDDVCYMDENGEMHCTGGEAAEQKCCGGCEGKKCEGSCCHKSEGACGEKPQGCCEEAVPAKGQCTKCAKCQPCPMDINIPVIIELVNKAKAAGKVTPELRKQYDALKSHASDCFECGACESKCPNEVKVIETMKEAVKLFGK